MRSTLKRSILAVPQPPLATKARRLRLWYLVLGTSGFLTWMWLGSGDLPVTVNGPIETPAQEKANLQMALGGAPEVEPVVIAIIDTGIDRAQYQELLWKNPFETMNGIDDDHNGLIDDVNGWNMIGQSKIIDDVHGHGTHVTGIIAQQYRMRQSLGLELRPIRFMILKYYEQGHSGRETLNASLRAFKYAIDHNADIINYSGGGASASPEEEELVRFAQSKNILLVAAAGNEGANSDREPFFPADYETPNIISVGATDANFSPVASSNYGRRSVDLTATGAQIESSLPGGKVGAMTGTSQATAFVTAAAAMIMARQNSGIPFTAVIDQILATGQAYHHLRDRSRSGVQLNLTRAATQRSSENVFTGQRMRNPARIPALLFAAEPEAHPTTN